MKITKKSLAAMRRISRQNDLARQQAIGFRRSSTWGGKPTAHEQRRSWRKDINNGG